MDNFDKMFIWHKGERAICLDNWGALVIDEGKYEVVWVENFDTGLPEPGSIKFTDEPHEDKVRGLNGEIIPGCVYCPDRTGHACVWIKDWVDGKIDTRLAWPFKGDIKDVLKVPSEIDYDIKSLMEARLENPF